MPSTTFTAPISARRSPSRTAYTHAKARSTGNLWLRHAKQWRRFDLAASAGISLTPYGTSALWSLSGGYTPAAGLHLGIEAFQSMRLPTFTDLYYTSPAQINNLDLTPESAVTYLFDTGYMKNSWRLSLQTYYRAGRDIIDWVWREDMGDKWHSRAGQPPRHLRHRAFGRLYGRRRLSAPRDAFLRLYYY